MQLAHAMLNTNKTIKNKPKSPKQIKAEAEHQAWLKKNGVHLDQLKKQKTGKLQTTYKSDNIKTSDIIVDGGRAMGIMANLHRESPEIQRAILEKASRTMPLYNKGGYQFATPDTDMTTVGSRSRRL